MTVKGACQLVDAVPGRLRRQQEDDQPGEQAAKGGQQKDRPFKMEEPGGSEVSESPDQLVRAGVDRPIQQRRRRAPGDADDDGQPDTAAPSCRWLWQPSLDCRHR